jgi:hypothetical protein
MVLVRTGDKMHAVLVPVLEDAEGAARFVNFLRNSSPQLEIRLAKYTNGEWQITPDTKTVDWPIVRREDLQNDIYQ